MEIQSNASKSSRLIRTVTQSKSTTARSLLKGPGTTLNFHSTDQVAWNCRQKLKTAKVPVANMRTLVESQAAGMYSLSTLTRSPFTSTLIRRSEEGTWFLTGTALMIMQQRLQPRPLVGLPPLELPLQRQRRYHLGIPALWTTARLLQRKLINTGHWCDSKSTSNLTFLQVNNLLLKTTSSAGDTTVRTKD